MLLVPAGDYSCKPRGRPAVDFDNAGSDGFGACFSEFGGEVVCVGGTMQAVIKLVQRQDGTVIGGISPAPTRWIFASSWLFTRRSRQLRASCDGDCIRRFRSKGD